MTHAQNRRATAGYPVLGFFQKCSRFICPKYILYSGFLSKKKIWSHGTTLGSLGGLIWRGNIVGIFSAFFMLKIGLYDLYPEVIVIGATVSKLDSSSLCQNTARPAGGRWKVILCKIDRNIIRNKHTKKFCTIFKTETAPVTLRI